MAHHEPEITEIASYIATKVPTEGVESNEAVDAWRAALRYARTTGVIDDLADEVSKEDPFDVELQMRCVEVAS